jgi:hypothetical protein
MKRTDPWHSTGIPTACGAFTGEVAPEYGRAFGMNVRFKTKGGDAPVPRHLWLEENGEWRILIHDVEIP